MSDNEPLDLDAIEARLKAATPGPWQAVDLPYNGIDDPMIVNGELVYIAQTAYDMQSSSQEHDVDADTIFIANAPADVAALLGEVKRLREEKAKLISKFRAEADDQSWHDTCHYMMEQCWDAAANYLEFGIEGDSPAPPPGWVRWERNRDGN
jgi:hypothetical protein